MKRPRLVALSVIVLSTILLAGCSSDDDTNSDGSGAASADTAVTVEPSDEATTPASSPPAEDEGSAADAARRLMTAYAANDADTACSLQTERYTKDQITSAIEDGQLKSGATCRAMVAVANGYYEAFGIDVAKLRFDELGSDGETVKVKMKDPDYGDSVLVFVQQDGNWLLDEELDAQQ